MWLVFISYTLYTMDKETIKKKVIDIMIANWNNPKDVEKMIGLYFDYTIETYGIDTKPKTIAHIIRTLHS